MAHQPVYALFGGNFDPPHVGHVLAAHYVLLTGPAQRVFVVPCGRHAFGKDAADFEDRLAMCRLAFAGLGEAVSVLDIEGRRGGTSYTVDTVRELREAWPEARFELVVGSDVYPELPQWKEADALLDMVDLRVLPRLGYEGDRDLGPFYLPEVSSTELREALARGEDMTAHLPARVRAYIDEHGLYRR